MKLAKSLLTLSLLAAAVQASASTYDVTGTLDSVAVGNIKGKISGFITVNSVTNTLNPTAPSLSGSWDIDTALMSVLGNVTMQPSFVMHSDISSSAGLITSDTTFNNAAYSLSAPTSASWNASTLTLTLTDTFAATSGTTHNVTGTTVTDGNLASTAPMTLTLVFADASLSKFAGTGQTVVTNTSNGLTTTTTTHYTFSGMSAVPVPAAAWLFGSALVGLAGVSRRKVA